MKTIVATSLLIGLTFVAPIGALNCYICDDCTVAGAIIVNQTCQTPYDACMKIDFGSYSSKRCGTRSTMSTKDGFKTNMPNLYNRMVNDFGQSRVEAELTTNINSQNRNVLSTCQDRDYCNNAMQKTYSLIVAALGMATAYVFA